MYRASIQTVFLNKRHGAKGFLAIPGVIFLICPGCYCFSTCVTNFFLCRGQDVVSWCATVKHFDPRFSLPYSPGLSQYVALKICVWRAITVTLNLQIPEVLIMKEKRTCVYLKKNSIVKIRLETPRQK